MSDLKKVKQRQQGSKTGMTDGVEQNEGAEFGTAEKATRGTNRDADDSGTSKNQGHGHPRHKQ